MEKVLLKYEIDSSRATLMGNDRIWKKQKTKIIIYNNECVNRIKTSTITKIIVINVCPVERKDA